MKLIATGRKTNHVFIGIHQKIYQLNIQGSKNGEDCVVKVFELPGMVNSDYAIVAIELDAAEEYLYAIYSNKYLCSWNIATGDIIGKQMLKKKATALTLPQWEKFTVALISDKAGDVWGYSGPSFNKEELLAGHTASVITDMCYIGEISIIATADRDEKIRISSFPDLETVKGYLLGHSSVLSSISPIQNLSNRLYMASTGWDHKIMLWDLETFALKQELLLGSAASLPIPATAKLGDTEMEITKAVDDKNLSEEKADDNDGDEVEDMLKYEEAEFGHYPIKMTNFNNQLAVIYKDESKIDLFHLEDTSDVLVLTKTIPLPAVALDIAFLSPTHLMVLLPKPHLVQICLIDTGVLEAVRSTVFEMAEEKIDQKFYISLMGYDGDAGMKKHALDRPFNKEENINYEAKRGSKRSKKH